MKDKTPRITEREKDNPVYRKKLEAENEQLTKSLKQTQDQASLLQQKNSDVEKENLILKERLKNFGWRPILDNLAFLFLGAAITYFIEQRFKDAAYLALIGTGIFLSTRIIENIISWVSEILNK